VPFKNRTLKKAGAKKSFAPALELKIPTSLTDQDLFYF
jgi:hypothetical protein